MFRFFSKGEALGSWVSKEQIQFIKLMIEDRDFLFWTNDLVKQEWFDVPEMRDIIRVIRDFYDQGFPISYKELRNVLEGHYDTSTENREISWLILSAILDEMEKSKDMGWKGMFLERLRTYVDMATREAMMNGNYDF